MAEVKLDSNFPSESEQNGALEPPNENEEAVESSPTGENEDDEEKGTISIFDKSLGFLLILVNIWSSFL